MGGRVVGGLGREAGRPTPRPPRPTPTSTPTPTPTPTPPCLQAGDGAQHDLRVQVVRQHARQLGLDGQLRVEQGQVKLELGVAGDDDALAVRVVLRPPRAPKHLHHVQGGQLHPRAAHGVVDLAERGGGGYSRNCFNDK